MSSSYPESPDLRPDLTARRRAREEVEQRRLELAQDYKAVFSGPAGERVLKHLRNHVLHQDKSVGAGSERAAYFAPLHDAWLEIQRILDFDPRQEEKPIVRRSPYSRHNKEEDNATGSDSRDAGHIIR